MSIQQEPLSIIMVDDHPIVRTGIKKIIENSDAMRVSYETDNGNDAIREMSREMPDFAIVDISLEGQVSGIDLVKAIKERFKNIKVLVLSMHDEALYIERALKAGADGYITKKDASTSIVEGIEAIKRGDLYLSRSISGKLVKKLLSGNGYYHKLPVDSLSNRELEVFELIGNGFSTGEIAEKLNLSVNTIESHRRHIKEKLNIQSGPALVKEAVQWTVKRETGTI